MSQNKTASALTRRASRGFTLIELLTVIVIIAILAALTLGLSKYAMHRSTESRIRAEIKSLETALEAYKLDKGSFPTAIKANGALMNSKLLYQALSGNSAGTGLTPDAGSRSYFNAFKTGKDGNLQLDKSDNKYYIADPLGNPYFYVSGDGANQKNPVSFDLWSYGLDSQNGTSDDIANWSF